MFKLVVSYDGNSPHWNKQYQTFGDAVMAYSNFNDWGFAKEFATITLHVDNHRATKTYRRPN